MSLRNYNPHLPMHDVSVSFAISQILRSTFAFVTTHLLCAVVDLEVLILQCILRLSLLPLKWHGPSDTLYAPSSRAVFSG